VRYSGVIFSYSFSILPLIVSVIRILTVFALTFVILVRIDSAVAFGGFGKHESEVRLVGV
jgi:hypothetical protein